MKPEDIKAAPKLYCENVMTGFSNEIFVLGMQAGKQAQVYAFTPAHAKRLLKKLEYEISEYENKNGEITAEWSPNVVSPVQRANPPSEGS
tara:strand:+ start:880 stop:1149 length:270 start_codon:yes stop_codon:yes gene_type:complete